MSSWKDLRDAGVLFLPHPHSMLLFRCAKDKCILENDSGFLQAWPSSYSNCNCCTSAWVNLHVTWYLICSYWSSKCLFLHKCPEGPLVAYFSQMARQAIQLHFLTSGVSQASSTMSWFSLKGSWLPFPYTRYYTGPLHWLLCWLDLVSKNNNYSRHIGKRFMWQRVSINLVKIQRSSTSVKFLGSCGLGWGMFRHPF